jgi:hypothetical protein
MDERLAAFASRLEDDFHDAKQGFLAFAKSGWITEDECLTLIKNLKRDGAGFAVVDLDFPSGEEIASRLFGQLAHAC